jgi:hypothetical protein
MKRERWRPTDLRYIEKAALLLNLIVMWRDVQLAEIGGGLGHKTCLSWLRTWGSSRMEEGSHCNLSTFQHTRKKPMMQGIMHVGLVIGLEEGNLRGSSSWREKSHNRKR